MTSLALSLVLLAACFHALWNLAAKSVRGDSTVFVWLYFTASALICLPVGIGQLLVQDHRLGWELVYAPLAASVLHIGYSVTLQRGYRLADLGVVYPVARGTGPLIAVVVAVLLLGERPASPALVGGLIVIVGILVVSGRQLLQRSSRMSAGLKYGLLTGVAIAGYTLWDAFSVTDLGIAPIVYFSFSCVGQSLLMLPWVLRKRAAVGPTWAVDWRAVLVVAVLSPLAYILVLYAMQMAPVALVAPVRESSIVIGALLAWWIFREQDPVRRILGALIVGCGISLVAVS